MLSVIDLTNITFERTYPYTRNRQGRMVQEPYFIINEGEQSYHLKGRLLMWSFLDSLYSQDPLPRGPVEDDIFAPTIDTPSMLSLFNEFKSEAASHNRYLVLEHNTHNIVSIVRSLDQYVLSTEIEKVGAMLEGAGFFVQYRPSIYTDSNRGHLRPSLFCRIGPYTLRVSDIGSSYYMSVTGFDIKKKKYCLLPPRTCKKNSKNLNEALRDIIDIASVGVAKDRLVQMGVFRDEVDESSFMMTRELDTLLHDRLRRCI